MDPDVLAHYALGVEEDRLTDGPASRIEFARTKELLARILPPPPLRILDVGGGPGRYASWLAERGDDVHLVDPVPLHVGQAKRRASERAPFTVACGDARQLPVRDGSFDAVLLMGPLYHLPELPDRLAALAEARRAVGRDGPVVVAAISRFASLLDGLSTGTLADPAFASIVEEDLLTGRHRNPTERPEFFTTAYFHRPEELRVEMQDAGLRFESLFGVEGPGRLLWERWDETGGREAILRVARALETEASTLGVSSHLLAVGRR